VGNGYTTNNAAIMPSVLDKDFYLGKVIEFEVEEEFYNKPYVLSYPEHITLAAVKNVRIATQFDRDGNILW
jgi:hypothetical protein